MKSKLFWIETLDYEEAGDSLKHAYDGVRGPDGQLDNLYRAFSLRPHTIRPADDLYRAVLHDAGNTLPKWLSELVGTYVAILAGCEYARTHHGHNFARLFVDPERADAILNHLARDEIEHCGDARTVGALAYARKLCLEPRSASQPDVDELSALGWSDGEILEIVQIVSMFSYFVRVINGVGVSREGEARTGLY